MNHTEWHGGKLLERKRIPRSLELGNWPRPLALLAAVRAHGVRERYDVAPDLRQAGGNRLKGSTGPTGPFGTAGVGYIQVGRIPGR